MTLKYTEPIRRRSQIFTTLFRPIKGFICNCNTAPSSIFKTSSNLGQKNPASNWLEDRDWVFEIYFKLLPDTIAYIRWNHFRKSSSSRCTFFRWNTPSTTNYSTGQKNETTIPNAESIYLTIDCICSFKWFQRWKWNRNAYNEQQKNFQWG